MYLCWLMALSLGPFSENSRICPLENPAYRMPTIVLPQRNHCHRRRRVPHFYEWPGTGNTVSRKIANNELTKLYWPSRKRTPKRLIVLAEPKKWRDTTKRISGAFAARVPPPPNLIFVQAKLVIAVADIRAVRFLYLRFRADLGGAWFELVRRLTCLLIEAWVALVGDWHIFCCCCCWWWVRLTGDLPRFDSILLFSCSSSNGSIITWPGTLPTTQWPHLFIVLYCVFVRCVLVC